MPLDRYHPIGTPDELADLDLSGNEYFSCSVPTTRNRGCRHWGQCTMRFKGMPGHAPENLGVYRESWQSGHIKTMIMPCHRYYDHLKEWTESKDVVQIIAHVGEDILLHETYEEPRASQVNTVTGRSMPAVKHRDAIYQVMPFVRPEMEAPHRMKAKNVRDFLNKTQAERGRQELLSGIKAKDGELPKGVLDGENKGPGKRPGGPGGTGKDSPGTP